MNEQNTLNISEKFYSVQCECVTTGYPAYFIRLKGCNLACGFDSKHLSEILKAGRGNTESGTLVGNLHQAGHATWTCDTAPIWLFGDRTSYEDIVQDWKQLGILDWVLSGRVHIIATGGEPTAAYHQKDLARFFNWLQITYVQETDGCSIPYIEIETNGTVYIEDHLNNWLDQINCSVKLANSGMSKERRIIPSAINRIIEHKNYWFKYVISTEEDLKEIEEDFIKPFNIDPKRVVMMPGLDKQENFHERTRFVLEMAKKYGYIGLTRLHVSAWNQTTGV